MSDTCFNCGQKLPRRVALPQRIIDETMDELEVWLYGTDFWQSVEDVLIDAGDTSRFDFAPADCIPIGWVWERFDVGTKVGIRKTLAKHLRFERKRWKQIDRFMRTPLRFVEKEAS